MGAAEDAVRLQQARAAREQSAALSAATNQAAKMRREIPALSRHVLSLLKDQGYPGGEIVTVVTTEKGSGLRRDKRKSESLAGWKVGAWEYWHMDFREYHAIGLLSDGTIAFDNNSGSYASRRFGVIEAEHVEPIHQGLTRLLQRLSNP